MRLLVQIFDILLFPVAAVIIDVDTGRTWYGAVESCQYVDVLAVVEMGILDVSIDKVGNKSGVARSRRVLRTKGLVSIDRSADKNT